MKLWSGGPPNRAQAPSLPRSRLASRGLCVQCLSEDAALLNWLVREGSLPAAPSVKISGIGDARGLVVADTIQAGEVILSVPFDKLFIDDAELGELPTWGGRMALRLLRAKSAASHACEASAGDERGWEGAAACDAASFGPWLDALPGPGAVLWPPAHLNLAEVQLLQDESCMSEMQLMRRDHDEAWQGVQGHLQHLGFTRADWDWANAVIHSRCFLIGEAQTHMMCPGIDMVNHSCRPNAAVRVQHSPNRSQGLQAVAEVCDPPAPEPSRFELVAGDAAISKDSEVTISYGAWPNEVFLLLHGFVDVDTPHDAVCLFDDFEDWLHAAADGVRQAWAAAQQHPEHSLAGSPCDSADVVMERLRDALTAPLLEALGSLDGGALDRLVVTAAGFDTRTLVLSQLLDKLWAESADAICSSEDAPELWASSGGLTGHRLDSGSPRPAPSLQLGLKVLSDRINARKKAFNSLSTDLWLLGALQASCPKPLPETSLEYLLSDMCPAGSDLASTLVHAFPALGAAEAVTLDAQLGVLGVRKAHVILALQYRACKQALLEAASASLPSTGV